MPKKKTILFVSYLNAHFAGLVHSALLLKETGKYDPILLVSENEKLHREYISLCHNKGISIYYISKGVICLIEKEKFFYCIKLKNNRSSIHSPSSKVNSFIESIIPSIRVMFHSLFNSLLLLNKEIITCKSFVKDSHISGIVLAEDNAGYNTGVWAKIGRSLSIPVIVVPYTIANRLEPAESFFNVPSHQVKGLLNTLVARICPQWVYAYKNHNLLRLPWNRVISQESLGIAPP